MKTVTKTIDDVFLEKRENHRKILKLNLEVYFQRIQ